MYKRISLFLGMLIFMVSVINIPMNASAKTNKVDVTTLFNATEYAEMYPDVVTVVGTSEKALLRHYVMYGIAEGRQPSSWFNPKEYLATYSDLNQTAKNKYTQALIHYLTYGITEGRSSCADHDVSVYLAENKDVKSVFGTNVKSVIEHYNTYGQKENRVTSVVEKLKAIELKNKVKESAAKIVDTIKQTTTVTTPPVVIEPTPTPEPNEFTVTFYDHFDLVDIITAPRSSNLLVSLIEINPTTVKYSNDDNDTEYEFDRWDTEELLNIQENKTINAVYVKTKVKVTFENYDGSELYSTFVTVGSDFVEPPISTPTRLTDDFYEYSFREWNNVYRNIQDPLTITATYNETPLS